MALKSENYQLQNFVGKAMVDLPALPTVVFRVLEATDRETVTTAEIEALISADAAITSKILKVVNSAYFGLPRQVGSIAQAISILGLHQVRNLVLSVGVLNALSSPNPKILDIQKKFWEHSFASATCAQTLAKRKGLSSREQSTVFLGGLLHDVGRLFLFTLFNQAYQNVMAESVRLGESTLVTEQRLLGTTHAELGGALAVRWNLPDDLAEMIRHHEEPETVTNKESLARLYSVHIADRLSCENWEKETESTLRPWSDEATEWLGFSDQAITELRVEVAEYLKQAKEMMGVV